MTSPVITVNANDDFHVVQDKMAVHDIRHLPVVDHNGQVVGLVSQRHLYKIHSPRKLESGEWYYDKDMLDSFILKRVMVPDPRVLKPHTTLVEAMRDMVEFKIGCIPVVDDFKRSVGILTRDGILAYLLTL